MSGRDYPRSATRIAAILLVAPYMVIILAIGGFVRPVDRAWLIGIALLPAVACFLIGIPKAVRSSPRRIVALLHLIVYPLFAAIVFGLPGAFITFQIGQLFAV